MSRIRQYLVRDQNGLCELMQMLQDHVANLDPLHLNKASKSFDVERYIDRMLTKVSGAEGIVFVAEEESIIGFIAGVISRTSDEEAIELCRTTDGRILELVVDPAYRGQQIGKALIGKMEQYFVEKGCEYVRAECFASNTGAHMFYEKCGYSGRSIEMIKKVEM